MYFQKSTWSISTPRLVIGAASSFEISCGKNRQKKGDKTLPPPRNCSRRG